MRTALVVVLVALTVAGVGLVGPARASLQEATPAAAHPIVGAWRGAGLHVVFTTDGAVIAVNAEGRTYLGVWEATTGDDIVFEVEMSTSEHEGERFSATLTLLPGGNEVGGLGQGTLERMLPPEPIEQRAASTAAEETEVVGPADPEALTATACRVEPRTIAEVETVVAAATPTAERDITDESELPLGEPAGAAETAAVTAAAREFAGCINAFDYPRWLALMTDAGLATVVGPGEVADLFAIAGTPESDADGPLTIAALVVRDVRVLPDGRVGAVVEWGAVEGGAFVGEESNFHIFERVGERWLLDEEIGSF